MPAARFPLELAVVWGLLTIDAIAILATYSRLLPRDLYNVSGSGLTGGMSRVLVFLNFPVALVAIAILAVLAERLATRSATVTAVIGIIFSGAVVWPGIVKEADLDAKPVNAIAALGIAAAAALTVVAARRLDRPTRLNRQAGDWLRIVAAAATLALGVPWIGADLGVSFNGVPVLGTLYQTGELRTQPNSTAIHPAVHLGHHHGMDGVLLVLSALLLSRLLFSIRRRWLRGALGAYLALMLCYGAGNVANDFWLEQVAKRGWTDWEIPDVVSPNVSVAWGLIVVAAAALWGVSAWRTRGSA